MYFKSSTTPYKNAVNHLNLPGRAILNFYIPLLRALNFRSYVRIRFILRQAVIPWRWCSFSSASKFFPKDLLKSWVYRKREKKIKQSPNTWLIVPRDMFQENQEYFSYNGKIMFLKNIAFTYKCLIFKVYYCQWAGSFRRQHFSPVLF